VVAQLGHKEGSEHTTFPRRLGETIDATVGTLDDHLTVGLNHVALDPGVEMVVVERDIVLRLAGLDTAAAPDALVHVDAHAVEVVRGIVAIVLSVLRIERRDSHHAEKNGRGVAASLNHLADELATVHCPPPASGRR
jgi:hypothetical protein